MQAGVQTKTATPAIGRTLLGGLVAGLSAALISIIFYYSYLALSSAAAYSEVNIVSITIASVIPNLIGAIGYWVLMRFMPGMGALFVAGGLLLGVLSSIPNFVAAPYPNPGFAIATVPLHLFAAIACVVIIPRFAAHK